MHKKYELSNLINTVKPLAICLQETFTISDKDKQELNDLFKNYLFYFNIREFVCRANPRGGLALMIHKDVPHTLLRLNTELESVVVDVKFRGKQISICSIYLAPNRNFT